MQERASAAEVAKAAAAGEAPSPVVLRLQAIADRFVYGFEQNMRLFHTNCAHDDCVAAHVMTLARAQELAAKNGVECLQVCTVLAIAARTNCLCAIVHVANALTCTLEEALRLLHAADFDIKRVLREACESEQPGEGMSSGGGAAGGK